MGIEYKDERTGFITRSNERPAQVQVNHRGQIDLSRHQIEAFLLSQFGVISPENQANLDKEYPRQEVQESVAPKFGEIGHGERTPAASGRIYTEAELQNHSFFMANKADILVAQREGRLNVNVYEPRGW